MVNQEMYLPSCITTLLIAKGLVLETYFYLDEIPNKITTIIWVTHHYSRYCSHESFWDLGNRSMQRYKYIVHTQLACSYYAKKKRQKVLFWLYWKRYIKQSAWLLMLFKPIICIWQGNICFCILSMILIFSARIFQKHAVLRSLLSWETSRKRSVLCYII